MGSSSVFSLLKIPCINSYIKDGIAVLWHANILPLMAIILLRYYSKLFQNELVFLFEL